MQKLYLDIETYCDLDIRTHGPYVYTEHPSFRILMCAWAVGDADVQITEDISDIKELGDDAYLHVAHNAAFERLCFNAAGVKTRIDMWEDTAVIAALNGYPRALDKLTKALGCEDKDSAGTRLINIFCKPGRGSKTPDEAPEQWQEFKNYCVQDVVAMRDADSRIHPRADDRDAWIAAEKVNDRGINIDTTLVLAAIEASKKAKEALLDEAAELTGLANPNSPKQLTAWLAERGVELPNMQRATVDNALKSDDVPDDAKRALEIRLETSLAATSKFQALADRTSSDGRLRGGFKFAGAHTWRWAGSGVQMQNLPRASAGSPGRAEALIIDTVMGAPVSNSELKSLVRGSFIPTGNNSLIVADYSAIEARVLAWLAGESWVLEAFELGRDLYVETGRRMGMGRKEGKVAVLALGYQGAVGSMRAMGAEGTDVELQHIVDTWRKANPAIVRFWYALGKAFEGGGPAGRIKVKVVGRDRWVMLPSGRPIIYHGVKREGRDLVYKDPRLAAGYEKTYGGKLTENVTQAVARDLLAGALVRLEQEGLRTVAHIHDEVLVDGGDLSTVCGIMATAPDWAAGLPLAAEGDELDRYRKV